MEFWTSFRDELKACKMLTIGVLTYTICVVVMFTDSLIKGNPLWLFVSSLPVVWMLLAPKRIRVCKEGIVRLGRLIPWRDLKLIGEDNGKLVFKHDDFELRVPREVIRYVDIQNE